MSVCEGSDKRPSFCIYLRVAAAFGSSGPVFGKVSSFFTPRQAAQPAESTPESNTSTSNSSAAQPHPVRPIVHIDDRVHHQEATLLGFMAENSMSLSMAPRLVSFAKELAWDASALNKLSVSRASATYKLTYGLAKSMREETIEDLGDNFYSLNMDEATSSNHEKVLTVLISYFSNKRERVVIQHLGSVSLLRVTSAQVVDALDKMLNKNGLKWSRCLSILMDSCNVMRGVRSGVEMTIRQEKAPHLLDINGDSCHHIHNASKAFTTAFGDGIEKLFGDIFQDFENKQFQDCLALICLALDVKYTRPERFLKHRWLSALNSSADTLRLFDALTVLYYEFLPKLEKTAYHSTVIDIFTSKKVNVVS